MSLVEYPMSLFFGCLCGSLYTRLRMNTFFLSDRFALFGFAALIFSAPSLRAQTNADCLLCHSDPGLTMQKGKKEVSLFVDEAQLKRSTHRKLSCTSCHAGFNPEAMPHKETIEPVNCLTCHRDAPIKHTFHPKIMRSSGRNGTPDQSCRGCHGAHDVTSPKSEASRFHTTKLTESCGTCHSGVQDAFQNSAHSAAQRAGVRGAPNCLTCHQNSIAYVRSGRDTTELKIAQEKLCLSCHLDDPNVRARTAPSAGFIAAYENSVHGAALLRGNGKAANCVDCHGSHQMKKGVDPTALMSQQHIPETCAKCHANIAQEYGESVHGVAAARGNRDSPVCTSCHGEHNILAHTDPRSRVSAKNVSAEVCSPCHSSLSLTAKYGLESDRFKTFSDSYHGLAIREGSVKVANCASCHGSHSILPSRDPRSSINKSNLATMCGNCHPGANERFAIGSVHVVIEKAKEPTLYWIANLYIFLIISLVGGMLVHNAADFVKKAKRKLLVRRGLLVEEHHGHSLYLRMTVSERLQHVSLLLSFTILVITGFMLRYPDAWWVQAIREINGGVFDLRSLFHRAAAVVMVAASLYHIYYVFFTRRGKQLILDLLPRLQDVSDAIAVVRYNFGFEKEKPKFGRFSYIEKSEYWALVWGTAVMAITGVIMWFDNTFIGLFTKLGYDIARTIHFYEAWLATLAIIIWHIYYVIFNPDVYPMNLAWLTGNLTENEMAEEHPLELEEIKRYGMRGEMHQAQRTQVIKSSEEVPK